MRLSDCVQDLNGQPMFGVLKKVRELEAEGHDIINMSVGESDFNPPSSAIDAMVDSLMDGQGGKYCPASGIPALKRKAQEATLASRGFKPDLDQLLPTAGANPQVWYALKAICNAGDSVLIPDPGFPSYSSICKLEGIQPIPVRLRASNGFQMEPSDVEDAVLPSVKAIIINSPSNPCGSVMDEDRYRAIYDICTKYGLFLISDEVYARLVYSDTPFFSPSQIDHCRDRVVVVNGFSKSYAMTGWRLGVSTAPAFLTGKMALILETTSSCVPPFIQMAGAAVLGTEDTAMLDEYRKRRDCLVEGLRGLDKFVDVFEPQGAFYVWALPTAWHDYLAGCGVAVAGGYMFGDEGKDYVRFSFANNPVPRLQEAVDRIRDYLG